MVCVPWGRISYPGFKEVSIINTQLPNFRFHNMRKVRFNYSNVCVCSWKMVARAFPRKCEQDWTIFPLGKASQHHVGYEVHTLLTVFVEVEDSWPLSSLTKSSNILSNEVIASGQALTAKYHIVHPFVIRGLTRTTAAEFCCPSKNVQNKSWLNFQLEELWSNTKSNRYPFSPNQRSVKIEVNKFWVEPRTPEKYVRLHPFIEFRYRIWI